MRVMGAADSPSDEILVEEFRASLIERDLSPATIKGYLHDLKVFKEWLDWVLEGRPVPLSQVGTVDLAAFRQYLIQKKSQKPSTVNRRLQALRLFFRWLEHEGRIQESPAENVRFMRMSPRRKPSSLKRTEVMSLLRTAGTPSHGTAKRNYALIQLMLQTGLRVGEVAALRNEDLRISERSGSVRVREGEGRKEREVPLNTTARRSLRDYLDTLEVRDPHAPVFRSSRGTPLSVRAIQQSVSTIAARAGIKRIPVSAHTLRHTFAVNYLKGNRGKLVELSNVMGHESLNTTAIYTRPSREELSDDLQRSPLNVLGE